MNGVKILQALEAHIGADDLRGRVSMEVNGA